VASPVLASEENETWIPLCSDIETTQVEVVENRKIEQNAEGLNRAISRVTLPCVSVHLAEDALVPTPAVVVMPGGGFMRLVIDKEGFDVATRFNADGIAVIVVKY
jgi:acetyl esterase/lipase